MINWKIHDLTEKKRETNMVSTFSTPELPQTKRESPTFEKSPRIREPVLF